MKKSLADYRREAGYDTQERLSMVIGVNRGTIARWELGRRYPRTPMLPRLAKILNVTEGEIISAITTAKHHNKKEATP